MELNEDNLNDVLGKGVAEMGAAANGPLVLLGDKYQADLLNFGTVIMGRKTYKFGYQFGLEPGQPAYIHMKHYIFSENLEIASPAKTVHIEKNVD